MASTAAGAVAFFRPALWSPLADEPIQGWEWKALLLLFTIHPDG